ncbi:uncharacterized protein N7511_006835 [Penicillium nucicola]|uniref:uncharacterized protein n=1 Tax=Penicillium nucicola TaxID=1850975 RepID=UPI002545587A|nr:uncharacterized protein N7511_006835 [Penicillium nucicola]KAJ5758141.1 hypothetical protein N7511_006835 [Penicillium nucicola]
MFPSATARLASQVHITAWPTPRNLAESKLVLKALQKHGEIVSYRNLKYDTTNDSPNRHRPMLAIYENAEAAERAIDSSPVTIPLPPGSAPIPQSNKHANPLKDKSASSPDDSPSIMIQIQSSRHNHPSNISRNPFYTTYNMHKMSPMYKDLIREGVPVRELADCLPSKKYHIGIGVKENIQEENRWMGAMSLMDLWKEGLKEKEDQKELGDSTEKRKQYEEFGEF